VPQLRREWKASASIGVVSFFAPFAVVGLLAYYGLGWNHRQAEIAGIAPLDHEPGSRLRRARGDGAQPDDRRKRSVRSTR